MSETMNPLRQLERLGQSIWLDFIRRRLITSGELDRLIADDGLAGMTSNPAIFEKAIAAGEEYDAAIAAAAPRFRGDPNAAKSIFEAIAIEDIRLAADRLRVVYDATSGGDGFVSLEVAPTLADDLAGTLSEARRLWSAVARPNLMIKVPGTRAGLPAIRELLAAGINVNITLLFARARYRDVAEAYLSALGDRLSRGLPIDRIASVASFFVSRIDTMVDAELELRAKESDGAKREEMLALRGRAAIANAKLAYRLFEEISAREGWRRLAAAGARPQRLLWASTSTKNPAYRDVLYVEELIGRDTVNTVPPETLVAFRDHGRARASLVENLDGAKEDLMRLEATGVSLDRVTERLLEEGIAKFVEPFEKLLAAVAERSRQLAHAS